MSLEEKENLIKEYAENSNWDQLCKLYYEIYPESEYPAQPDNNWGPLLSITQKADAISSTGKLDDAMKICKTILGMKIQQSGTIDGNNCKGVQRIRQSIGGLLWEQHKYDEALEILKDVLEKQIKIMGDEADEKKEDPHETRIYIANVLEAQGKLDEALAVFEKAYGVYVQMIGPELDLTAHIGFNITSLKLKIAAAKAESDLSLESILEIVGYGPDVFSIKHHWDDGKDTVLHRAVRTNNLSIIQTVFEDIVTKCEAENNQEKLFEFINLKNSEGRSPLCLALQHECENAVKYLLEEGTILGMNTDIDDIHLLRKSLRPESQGGNECIKKLILKYTNASTLVIA